MYREVCSTCHSIKFVAFRNLIGVSHSEAEVRRRRGFFLCSLVFVWCASGVVYVSGLQQWSISLASLWFGVGVVGEQGEQEQRGIKR